MKGLHIFLISLLCPHLWAQNAPIMDPLPEGPVLNNPEYAHWHIKIVAKDPRKLAAPPDSSNAISDSSPDGTPSKGPAQSIEVTKTKNIVHEHSIDFSGIVADTWYKDSLAFLLLGQQVNPGRPAYSDYIDYVHHDFPELSFVVTANYKGMVPYHGHKCLVFIGKPHITPYRGESEDEAQARALETTAYIDLETRLPLGTRNENTTATYTFDDPPTSLLIFPARLQAIADVEAQELKHLTTPHEAAYVP